MTSVVLLNQILALINAATPAVAAAVTEIKKMIGENGTMTFEMTLTIGQANLDTAGASFQQSLDQVNAELARLGKSPLD